MEDGRTRFGDRTFTVRVAVSSSWKVAVTRTELYRAVPHLTRSRDGALTEHVRAGRGLRKPRTATATTS